MLLNHFNSLFQRLSCSPSTGVLKARSKLSSAGKISCANCWPSYLINAAWSFFYCAPEYSESQLQPEDIDQKPCLTAFASCRLVRALLSKRHLRTSSYPLRLIDQLTCLRQLKIAGRLPVRFFCSGFFLVSFCLSAFLFAAWSALSSATITPLYYWSKYR